MILPTDRPRDGPDDEHRLTTGIDGSRRTFIRLAACVLGAGSVPFAAAASPEHTAEARDVSAEQLLASMRRQQALGYNLRPISNTARLQSGVFLDLATRAEATDPERRPLRIGHDAWLQAYLEVTGQTVGSAPSFVTVPHSFGEDYLVDYRLDRVVAEAKGPRKPLRALNVKAGWPDAPGAPTRYAYEDSSSSPGFECAHERITRYRLIDFGDEIVYDDIHGITGRATTGPLGLVFRLIGNATFEQARLAIATDGTQVSRTTARKGFTIHQTITVDRQGVVLKGLPEARADLELLERRLMAPLDIVYRPFDDESLPAP